MKYNIEDTVLKINDEVVYWDLKNPDHLKPKTGIEEITILLKVNRLPEFIKQLDGYIFEGEKLDSSIHIDCNLIINFDFGIAKMWATGKTVCGNVYIWNFKEQDFKTTNLTNFGNPE